MINDLRGEDGEASVSESNADGDFTTGARRERVRLSLSGGEEIHHASEQV